MAAILCCVSQSLFGAKALAFVPPFMILNKARQSSQKNSNTQSEQVAQALSLPIIKRVQQELSTEEEPQVGLAITNGFIATGVWYLSISYFCHMVYQRIRAQAEEALVLNVPKELEVESSKVVEEQTSEMKADGYVDIHIWLGRSLSGRVTTAVSGGIKGVKKPSSGASCGHVSMSIFQKTMKQTTNEKTKTHNKVAYVSFWPKDPKRLLPQLRPDLETDILIEERLPDVVIRLHHLDIPGMLQAFTVVKKLIQIGDVDWKVKGSIRALITDENNANCASCVWAVLSAGGLVNPFSAYSSSIRGSGPKDRKFYDLTRCNRGSILGGVFDGFFWTKSLFTPKGALLRFASAAEAYPDDKQETSRIMNSDVVSK